MKIIPTWRRSLERENEALKKQNEELKAEVTRCQEAERRSWNPRRIPHTRPTTDAVSSQPGDLPSYMGPTRSSSTRSALDSKASQATALPLEDDEIEVSPMYDDGMLRDADRDIARANFARQTKASISRFGDKQKYDYDRHWDRNRDRNWDVSDDDADVQEEKLNDVGGSDSAWAGLGIANEDTTDTDTALDVRSRLRDNNFYSTYSAEPASHCYIPVKVQRRFLNGALRLAQASLWNFLRNNWPHIQRRVYPESPAEIRFGRDELARDLLMYVSADMRFPPGHSAVRFPYEHTLYDVVHLRNAICHPRHHPSEDLDRDIQRAQNLAVTINDEPRAFKIRNIRDQLQTESRKAFTEIERRVGLAALPHAKPWPLHHQRLFRHMSFERSLFWGDATRYEQKYSVVLRRAAEDWKSKYIPGPGE